MRDKVTLNSLIVVIARLAIFTLSISTVWAREAEDFVSKIKNQHKKLPTKAYSNNYHFLKK